MPTIQAKPYDYTFEKNRLALVIIDMQRDFVEPGGFGAALGNDVRLLAPIIPTVVELLAAFRQLKLTVIHTKECHKPDLSDCPPAKLARGRGKLTIGDAGPMGRILIERGTRQRFRAVPATGARRTSHRQARQGSILCDESPGRIEETRHHASSFHWGYHGSLRENDHARSQRSRLRIAAGRRLHLKLLSRFQKSDARYGSRSERHRRLDGVHQTNYCRPDVIPLRRTRPSRNRESRQTLLNLAWRFRGRLARNRQASNNDVCPPKTCGVRRNVI